MGGWNTIGYYLQRPPYFSQRSAPSLVRIPDLHRACVVSVSGDFSGSCLIGRLCVLTSRPCQLIGVRSRFEERSSTGERDRGGTSRSIEQRGVGPDNRIHRLDRFFFYFSVFRGLNTGVPEAQKKAKVLSGLKLNGLRRNLWNCQINTDWELRCGWGFLCGWEML